MLYRIKKRSVYIMGQIQSAINQAIGTAAIASAIGSDKEAMKKTAKYGPGGEIEEKVLKKAGIKNPTLEQRQELEPKLRRMREEAENTDLREQQAKKFGIFPTEDSRDIRKKGLERKEKNIQELSKSFKATQDAADSMNDAVNSKTYQQQAFKDVKEGRPNPMKGHKFKNQRRY